MVDGGDFYPNSLVADPNTGCTAGAVAGLAAQFWGSVVDSSCLAATDSWPEDRSSVVLPDFTAEEVTAFCSILRSSLLLLFYPGRPIP